MEYKIEKHVLSNVLALCGCPCVLYRWIVLQITLKKQLRVLTLEIRDYSLWTLLNPSKARVTPLLSQMKLC